MQDLTKEKIEKAIKYLTPLAQHMCDDNYKKHMNVLFEAGKEYADIIDATPEEIGEMLAGM